VLNNLKYLLKKSIANTPGWHTNRKIVVIESDDWGSIRMPSKNTLEYLISQNLIPENDSFNKNDSLASEEDLINLFEVLSNVKDKNNKPAVLTANTIVANPDFNKIEASNFEEYHFEVFTETLKKYKKHTNSFNLWKEGIKSNIFHPQFHGREHVNINRWLNSLQDNDKNTKIAFDNKLFGLRKLESTGLRDSYMRALDFENVDQFMTIEKSLIEGLNIFKYIFGYNSKSFIAPSYVWDYEAEKVLNEQGVKYLQGIQYQYYPKIGKRELQKKINYIGKTNKLGQKYLIRNVFFEPTTQGRKEVVERALKRIDVAFKWKKPAIIGSHRLNYIGFINPQNRDQNLRLLKTLLDKIIQKWPNVEFMTSDQLGDLIKK